MLDNKAKPHQAPLQHLPGTPAPKPPETLPKPAQGIQGDFTELNDSTIGGKVTIAVLLYGQEHFNLHKRCLNSILATVPETCMDLRIAANQVGPETRAYLEKLPATKVYYDDGSRRKYPAMRQMFWDEQNPITTKWVIWFDDDTYCVQPTWLLSLARTIKLQPRESRVAMYGMKRLNPVPRVGGKVKTDWFAQAAWWRGRPLTTRKGITAPNGYYIPFITGGWWCLSTEALRACDIPDRRLNHNGGDVLIGLSLYQNNYNIKSWNGEKEYCRTNAEQTRGFHEKFPWL